MQYFALFYETVDGFTEKRRPYRPAHLQCVQEACDRGELLLARTPEARTVLAAGTGRTRHLGYRPVDRQSDLARRFEHHAHTEARYRPAAA